MAKFCSNCGRELYESDNVCGFCGTPVNKDGFPFNYSQNVNYQPSSYKKSNGMAIEGFVVSLVSTILCCGVFNLISLILSCIGLSESKKLDGSGKGLAIAGIIISLITIVMAIVMTVLGYSTVFIESFL